MTRANFVFTAGILICGQIRDLLESCKFRGMDIEWLESRGLLERTWTVRGSVEAVTRFREALERWQIMLDTYEK